MRFGVEGLLGLIPVAGDTVGAVLGLVSSFYVVRRHGLGRSEQAKMALNLAVEWVGGLTPLVGDLFDVAFKANVRNVKLLEEAIGGDKKADEETGSGSKGYRRARGSSLRSKRGFAPANQLS